MQDEIQATDTTLAPGRWTLLRDIGVLQFKLIVDGIRDLVLVPVSLIAGFISLVKPGRVSENEFYDLLRLGKKSERWINLFGAVDNTPATENEANNFPQDDIDAMVSRVESFVVEEYRKGGVTRQAKAHLDNAIDALHKLASGKSGEDRHF